MKTFKTCLILGVLAGCATEPPPNPWAGLEPASEPVPIQRVLPSSVQSEDGKVIAFVFDADAVAALDAYYEVSENNFHLGKELASQVNGLIHAGQAQRELSEIQREILLEERRSHLMQQAGLYSIILLGLAAAAL